AKNGYDVIERESSCDLVPLVVAAEPIAVVLDLMMPGENGIQAVEKLRADPRTRAVRVVMISAMASFAAAREASDLGVERYLVKPVSLQTVLAAVEGRTPKRSAA